MESVGQPRTASFGKSTRRSILRRTNFALPNQSTASNNLDSDSVHLDPEHILPLFKKSSRLTTHFAPYLKRRPPTSNPSQALNNLSQVEDGIVAGSSLPGSVNHTPNGIRRKTTLASPSMGQCEIENQSSTRLPPPSNSSTNDKPKGGLLSKCVGWLFGNQESRSSSPKTTAQPNSNTARESNSYNESDFTVPRKAFSSQRLPPPPMVASVGTSSNANTHLLSTMNGRTSGMVPSLTLPDLSTASLNRTTRATGTWFRSQSPFVCSDDLSQSNLPSTSSSSLLYSGSQSLLPSKIERRRPKTAHATLQIPFSSTTKPPDGLFSNGSRATRSPEITTADMKMRSASPLRNNTTRQGARISPTHRFSSLLRGSSLSKPLGGSIHPIAGASGSLHPRRFLNDSPGQLQSIEETTDIPWAARKRGLDRMSISPVRMRSLTRFPDGLDVNGDQPVKRQMFWDPQLGFLTQDQKDKINFEAERKMREKEGRPLPTNEAEKILEILETGRNMNFVSAESKRLNHLPNIRVPAPCAPSLLRSSSSKHLTKASSANPLAALYEEQALHSNPTIIAPISKRLEAERVKRLHEKKGRLRAELKKRKQFVAKFNHANDDSGSDQNQVAVVKTQWLRRRSPSEDVGTSVAPRRSTRKVGKLTSESARAKVNNGRKSRSQSVVEEEPSAKSHKPTELTRVTRSGKSKSSLAKESRNEASKDTESIHPKKLARTLKSLKSPSPIQEEAENDRLSHKQASVPQVSASLLQPTVRASPVPLQLPTTTLSKSTPSSLRPGRTFSSRRHLKAKVFSGREEDLPPLDEEDDSATEKENEKLKKIKLPTTFPSSFKLEKFSVSATQKANEPASSEILDKVLPSSAQPSETTLSGSGFLFERLGPAPSATATTDSLSLRVTEGANDGASSITSPLLSLAPPDQSKTVQPPPSSFFAAPKDTSDTSKQAVPPQASLVSGFSRIPSGTAPPNFFASIVTPSLSDKPEGTVTGSKVGLFGNQAPSNSTGSSLTPTAPVEKVPNDFAAPSTGNQLFGLNKSTQPTPSIFSFGNTPTFQQTPDMSKPQSVKEDASVPPSQANVTPAPFSFAPASQPPAAQSIFAPKVNTESNSWTLLASNPSTASSATTSALPTFTFGQPSTVAASSTGSSATGFPLSAAPMNSNLSPAAKTAPSIFGASSTTASATPPATGGFAFTVSASSDANKPANPGLFGNSSNTNTVASTSPFVFGAPQTLGSVPPVSQSGIGLSSTPSTSGPSSASLFVPTQASSTPFAFSASSTAPSLFGSTTANATGMASAPVFGGSNAASNQPTASNTPSVFNTTSGNPFGTQHSQSTGATPATNFSFGINTATNGAFNSQSTSTPPVFKFGSTDPGTNGQNTGASFFGNSGTSGALFGNGMNGEMNGNSMNNGRFGGGAANGMSTTTSSTFGNGSATGNTGAGMFGNAASAPSFNFGASTTTAAIPTSSSMSMIGATSNLAPSNPATGGIVFNMGSVDSQRQVKKLPTSRKKR